MKINVIKKVANVVIAILAVFALSCNAVKKTSTTTTQKNDSSVSTIVDKLVSNLTDSTSTQKVDSSTGKTSIDKDDLEIHFAPSDSDYINAPIIIIQKGDSTSILPGKRKVISISETKSKAHKDTTTHESLNTFTIQKEVNKKDDSTHTADINKDKTQTVVSKSSLPVDTMIIWGCIGIAIIIAVILLVKNFTEVSSSITSLIKKI